MEHIYLAKQPILDKDSQLYAYEILYRDAHKQSHITGDRYASASVISNILNKFGTKALLSDKRAFVKIDEKFLLNDIVESVPKEFFIFALLTTIKFTPRIVERIAQLKKNGYLFAINDVALSYKLLKKFQDILPCISYCKVDFVPSLEEPRLKEYVAFLQHNKIKVVATKIETQELYEQSLAYGFEYFEGYYFAKPKILENTKFEASHMRVLKLYNLLMMETGLDDLALEFEQSPEISVQLLQFINSGAFHFRKKISSIQQILTLLGRITVAKWLMLMIYAKSVSSDTNNTPLMLMVKQRTEIMEQVLQVVKPHASSSELGEAYFVGVISLMDVVFSMRLEDILNEMNISDEVKIAVLKEEGELGEIYALNHAIEQFDIEAMLAFEKRYNLQENTIQQIVVNTIHKVGIPS
jgi:EAL and modified HD-GYP domain-containing signal transduction protein